MKNQNKDDLTIEKMVVLAKLSNGKIYQVGLNQDETKTVKTTIELLHQMTVKILPDEIETIQF